MPSARSTNTLPAPGVPGLRFRSQQPGSAAARSDHSGRSREFGAAPDDDGCRCPLNADTAVRAACPRRQRASLGDTAAGRAPRVEIGRHQSPIAGRFGLQAGCARLRQVPACNDSPRVRVVGPAATCSCRRLVTAGHLDVGHRGHAAGRSTCRPGAPSPALSGRAASRQVIQARS